MKKKHFQLVPEFEVNPEDEFDPKKLRIPLTTHVGDQPFDDWADQILNEYRQDLYRAELLEVIIAAYSEGKKQIAMTIMRDTIHLPEVFWLALEQLVVDTSGRAKVNAALRHEESNRQADLFREAFKLAKAKKPAIKQGTFCDDYRKELIAKSKSITQALEREKDDLERLRDTLEVVDSTSAKLQIRAQIQEVKGNIKALKKAAQKVYSKKTLEKWIANS